MIQVKFDLSILTKKPAQSLCQLAVTFAGCSWKEIVALPAGWDGHELHPWGWEKPTHLRVFYIDDTNTIITTSEYVDIPITPFNSTGFEADIQRLKIDYSKTIQDRIYKEGKLQEHEVKWSIANRVVELNDDVPAVPGDTGFLTAAVAQFAQKLAPLNRGLNLVFYAVKEDLDPPEAAVGIVAFPIAAASTKWEPEANFPAVITGNPIGYNYKTNGGADLIAYCEVTKWPIGQNDKHPVKLRDKDGNFDGHVELSVNDVEDWVPGFLTRVGILFDHPALFHGYLKKNKKQLEWEAPTDIELHKNMIEALDNFLLSVLRDTLNTGYREGTSGDSILTLTVRQFCDDTLGEEHTLSNEQKSTYWATYAGEYNRLKIELDRTERQATLQSWKELLNTIKFDSDNEQNFKEVLAKLSFNKSVKGEEINEEIADWFRRWEAFIDLLTDNALVAAIASAEWGKAAIEAKWQPVIKKVLSQIMHELRLQQKEVLSNHYKAKIFEQQNGSADEIEKIKLSSIEAVQKYLDDRIKTNPLEFMPKPADPFATSPVPITLSWLGFLDYAKETSKEQVELESSKLFPNEKKMYDIPPALRITVDTYGAKIMTDDDLNDEISGHIIMMQRSKVPRETTYDKEWRCLNRVLINKPPTDPFYFVPAFLPETEGVKTPYLAVNNEKLSLIAGHQTFRDENHGKADETENLNTQYYWFDERHKGYALWYGYNYRFSGFVALNSGVLPVMLRANESEWNVPTGIFAPDTPIKFEEHTHLRRVPVSKMRVEARCKGANIKDIPKGLLPLAFELDEWKDHSRSDDDNTSKGTASHYLLANGTNYKQEEIVLNLRKPTTSFWNWYAWLGADAAVKPDGTKTYAQFALEMELEARDASIAGTAIQKQEKLCDPAVHNLVTLVIERKFPTRATLIKDEFDIDMGASDWLSDPEKQLTIALGDTTNVDPALAKITIAAGEIVRIKIHAQIKKTYFDSAVTNTDQRFYEWMKDQLIAKKDKTEAFEERGDYFLSNPVDVWFEAATKPTFSSESLWRNLEPVQLGDKVLLYIKKNSDNYIEFAYASRLEVKHQIWNWNGRLDESHYFLTQPGKLDPEDGKTTPAMEWEAWSFSDRPDFSSLVQETNLLASTIDTPNVKTVEQILFTDSRPGEEKALYYRFMATAYSRYELLGNNYVATIDSKVEVDKDATINKAGTENFWRRYLRKCSKTKRLPRPSVRFALPLTRSISECVKDDEINSSEVLIVLDDRWFAEGGLAEQLEVGVDLVSEGTGEPDEPEYLSAGNDPILTGSALGKVEKLIKPDDEYPYIDRSAKQPVMIFQPSGPVGLTFDFAAQTPKLKGAAFTIHLKKIENFISPYSPNIVNQLQPWSMAQIAVRRALRRKLCEPDMNVEALYSEWTAKEWVQFLPALDSLIPVSWRKTVRTNNEITIIYKKADDKISISIPDTVFPRFNSIITPATHHFFLIVTEKVYDIGGQTCENYLATYFINQTNRGVSFHFNDGDEGSYRNGQEGYVRIMIVRSEKITGALNLDRWEKNIWERLFGETGRRTIEESNLPGFTTIQNDASAAMPMISERIPYKIEIVSL